jgi:hypothetical protein
MKGIYLTEEGKKEIEAIITNLKKPAPHYDGIYVSERADERMEVFEEILSSATILPVEDNWDEIRLLDIIDSSGTGNLTKAKYPNGVIIKK